GDSGDILVETGKLRIADGGKIATNTVGQGDGGNVTIRAAEIEVSDAFIDFVGGISGIIATVGEEAQGDGGDITIETDFLSVFDGGQINAATLGMGNAGNIYIDANRLDVTGESDDGQFSSSISASASSNFSAGSVEIVADSVRISDDGEILVSSSGQGDAGNLEIVANSLVLDTEARLQADVNGGAQGNIDLSVSDALVLRRGGRITTNATSGSVGGNINISEGFIVGVSGENSDISANSDGSFGGRISLTTKGILGLQIREQLTPLSDITASSELGTEFSGDVEVNNLIVNSTLALVELPSAPADAEDQIATACDSGGGSQFTASGRGGVPISPTEFLTNNHPWVDRRLSYSGASELNATTISTSQNTIEVVSGLEVIEAGGWQLNQDGRVELVTSAIVASNPMPNCLVQANAG
ncbi:MAG: S-layer family protein, partial [Cyanobacteria bacterium P01_D01_bin.56]